MMRRTMLAALALIVGGLGLASPATAAEGDTKNRSACYAKATAGKADNFKPTTSAPQRAAVDRSCREARKGIAFYNAKNGGTVDCYPDDGQPGVKGAGCFASESCVQRAGTSDTWDCGFRLVYYTPTKDPGLADHTSCTGTLRVRGKGSDWRNYDTWRSSIACVA